MGRRKGPPEPWQNCSQWPRLASAQPGDAGALWALAPWLCRAVPRPAPPGPPQRPISVSQGAVAANEAQESVKLQLKKEVSPSAQARHQQVPQN